jgi:cold shock CspA family protein
VNSPKYFTNGPDAECSGRVATFDEHSGLGTIRADGGDVYPFHCIEIADGTRRIDVDSRVVFSLLPKLGRYEAAAIRPAIHAGP